MSLNLLDATAPTTDEVVSQITGALSTGGFSVSTLLTILVSVIGVTAVFAIAWFAYRFIKGKVSSAMRKGKL